MQSTFLARYPKVAGDTASRQQPYERDLAVRVWLGLSMVTLHAVGFVPQAKERHTYT